jgi:hypothetical protein
VKPPRELELQKKLNRQHVARDAKRTADLQQANTKLALNLRRHIFEDAIKVTEWSG